MKLHCLCRVDFEGWQWRMELPRSLISDFDQCADNVASFCPFLEIIPKE